MNPEYVERFRFSDGAEMNPWWVVNTLTEEEFDVCITIASSGILGCTETLLRRRRANFSIVDNLITEGILQRETRLDIAKRVATNPINIDFRAELENKGGFLSANRIDRKFIRLFDEAIKLATSQRTLFIKPDEMVYTTVDDGLREYLTIF
ncbi:MAG: hypothetical protein ABSC49_02415 [Candidatus Microgenomates bacterium]|jgi:hypothetical protein